MSYMTKLGYGTCRTTASLFQLQDSRSQSDEIIRLATKYKKDMFIEFTYRISDPVKFN